VLAVAIGPDGSWLATVDDAVVRTWLADGRLLADLATTSLPAACIAIAPDGTWLATGGVHDGRVRIWANDGTPELSRATD
jgi:WD40 repeat protein